MSAAQRVAPRATPNPAARPKPAETQRPGDAQAAAPSAPAPQRPDPAARAAAGAAQRTVNVQVKAPSAPASPQPDPAISGLLQVLELERLFRDATTAREVAGLAANELPRLLRAAQVFVFVPGWRKRLQLYAVTGLATIERTVPLVQAMERLARLSLKHAPRGGVLPIEKLPRRVRLDIERYPHKALLAVPLAVRANAPMGYVIIARDEPWSEAEETIARRLAATGAHALDALARQPRKAWHQQLTRRHLLWAGAVSAALLFVPVPMTILAPFEIGPSAPTIVTTGIDGVIDAVPPNANEIVKSGDVLARLVDVKERNRLELAEREVSVAEARIKKWQQLAFSDQRANHELAIAAAELRLKRAERDWAREQLAFVEIRAPRSGLALFADKRDLIGKPVAVGEKIMEIADPKAVEARLDVGPADGLVLRDGAAVRLFLDQSPLEPRTGALLRSDYQTRTLPNGTVIFRAVASVDGEPLRIGTRGTAQVFGQRVPLGAYLFRRPMAALRQWLGL
ncbi:MAG: hypothetical protein RL291_979 [Pseudomonadota bacterium]